MGSVRGRFWASRAAVSDLTVRVPEIRVTSACSLKRSQLGSLYLLVLVMR